MLFRRAATGWRPKITGYSPDDTRSPPLARMAVWAGARLAGRRGGPGRAMAPLRARLDGARVVHLHEPGVVVAGERPRLARGAGERDEVGVGDGRSAGPRERALGARGGEIARLAAEADARPVRRVEDGADSDPARLGGLRLLDAVARDVRRVVEPGEEGAVRGRGD